MKKDEKRFDPYVAAEALGSIFGLKEWERSRFAGEITGTYDDGWKTNELRGTILQLQSQKSVDVEIVRAVVDAMEIMNKEYMSSGVVHNFNANRESNAGYCHELAPIELCGHAEQRGYFNALDRILQKIGVSVDFSAVQQECDARTLSLLKECYLQNPTQTDDRFGQYMVSEGLENYLIDNNIAGAARGTDESNRQFVRDVVIPDLMSRGFGVSVNMKHMLSELKRQLDVEIHELEQEGVQQINEPTISIEDALKILAENPELIPWDAIEKHMDKNKDQEIVTPEFGNR